jgi:CheY-like chemotaxis protein
VNQVEMALLNLAVNARDAMADGGELLIAAELDRVRHGDWAELPAGNYARLTVRDTGEGMEAETLRRAVEPFFSTKGVGKGTGLGLSMVHGLAAQLGGGMAIESQPGEGTSVHLWLPLAQSPATSSGTGPEAQGATNRVGRALLADDEDLVRASAADMLAELGYEVVPVRSAVEALERVEGGERFDLVVTDHLMPGMTGAELASRLRLKRPDLPVLIVSGYAEADSIAPDLPRLTKPFRLAELDAAISAL